MLLFFSDYLELNNCFVNLLLLKPHVLISACFSYGTVPLRARMFAEKTGLLTLHYGKHHTALVDEIKLWFVDEAFTDVVIVCDDDDAVSVESPPPPPEPSKYYLETAILFY